MADYDKLNKRLTELEDKMKKSCNLEDKKSSKSKVTRKPSEYNIFMKNYFAKNSKDSKKTHRELFTEAAKAWGENKK